MIILGIETSCDDTGIALVECDSDNGCRILSNVVSSQLKIHKPFGGVVPNLAARAHLANIKPCLGKAFKLAKKNMATVDLIAVTRGPGLIPCLLVGANFAKALSFAWQKPIVGINHLEGHIYANWLNVIARADLKSARGNPVEKLISHEIASSLRLLSELPRKDIFPALCLIVSGGHTELILMKNHGQYQLIGETKDDASGEAFDKVAKLLGLGYPGGPLISKKAKQGNPTTFNLPRPMLKTSGADEFNFSFSGLKTAVFYLVKKENKISNQYINDMSASFQQAVIDVLIYKTIKAARKFNIKTILLSGGVAANDELRNQLGNKLSAVGSEQDFLVPPKNLCVDNGAKIAIAAFYNLPRFKSKHWSTIKVEANLKIATSNP